MLDLDHFLATDHRQVVRAVALGCGDGQLAAEAVEEAIVRAIETDRRGRPIDNPAAWITVVAMRWTNRWHRRRRVEAAAFSVLAPLQAGAAAGPDGDPVDIWRAVGRLPLRQRQAIVLHYLHDLDVASVAAVLGVSSGTVKTALARGRQHLHAALADSTEIDEPPLLSTLPAPPAVGVSPAVPTSEVPHAQ